MSDLPNLPQQVSDRAAFGCRQSGARVPTFGHPTIYSVVSSMYVKSVQEALLRCLDFLKTLICWEESLYHGCRAGSLVPLSQCLWSGAPNCSWALRPGSGFKLRGGLTRVPAIHKDHLPLKNSNPAPALRDNST